jgi:UDP-N-acetylglucosamine:LPS N-acetylglucosamine transferase
LPQEVNARAFPFSHNMSEAMNVAEEVMNRAKGPESSGLLVGG